MNEINNLPNWEYDLEFIETWDENPNSLKQKISERSDFSRISSLQAPTCK
jgi:hypothetical protein